MMSCRTYKRARSTSPSPTLDNPNRVEVKRSRWRGQTTSTTAVYEYRASQDSDARMSHPTTSTPIPQSTNASRPTYPTFSDNDIPKSYQELIDQHVELKRLVHLFSGYKSVEEYLARMGNAGSSEQIMEDKQNLAVSASAPGTGLREQYLNAMMQQEDRLDKIRNGSLKLDRGRQKQVLKFVEKLQKEQEVSEKA